MVGSIVQHPASFGGGPAAVLYGYRQTGAPSIENAPEARKDLFHRHDHTSGVLFATRGCPGQCDFCTIAVMYRYKLRRRPIAEVAARNGCKQLFLGLESISQASMAAVNKAFNRAEEYRQIIDRIYRWRKRARAAFRHG